MSPIDPRDVLPHREPFLMLDRCLAMDSESVSCERLFRPEEEVFAGHFPGDPIVPGVLLIEGLAQTLAYFALRTRPGHNVLLTGVDKAKFRRPVRPGETVRFDVTIDRLLMNVVHATGKATVGGDLCLSAVIKGYITESNVGG